MFLNLFSFIVFNVFAFLAWFWLATGTPRLRLTSHTSPTSPTSPPSFRGPEQRVKTPHSGPRYFLKIVFYNVFDVFSLLAQFWLATGTPRLCLTSHTSPTSLPSFRGPERRVDRTENEYPWIIHFSLISYSNWINMININLKLRYKLIL